MVKRIGMDEQARSNSDQAGPQVGDVCVLSSNTSRWLSYVKSRKLVVFMGPAGRAETDFCQVVPLQKRVPVPASAWHIPVLNLLAGGTVPQGVWWARCDLTQDVSITQLVVIAGERKDVRGDLARARIDPLVLSQVMQGVNQCSANGSARRQDLA